MSLNAINVITMSRERNATTFARARGFSYVDPSGPIPIDLI